MLVSDSDFCFLRSPYCMKLVHYMSLSARIWMLILTSAGFWLPLLAKAVVKATGVTDYNIVQNNGK